MTEKLGLALSGGGFRASFYHIGVLAQMAEQGLLRKVEVISTVSGGSIIGALYYLHVKKLLESKDDDSVTDQDYIGLVQQIEQDFLKATEKNIRMEIFSDFKANIKMLSASYSRSDRLAELYNEYLYQSVLEGVSNPVQMQELKIYPNGNKNFKPDTDNIHRQAKVPILVINATTLNTGSNWQFTAKTMGEHPNTISELNRKTIRLRRADSYANMVAVRKDLNHQTTTLGEAVAASACVPGLFTPLSITGLYKEGKQAITPLLVDGGVFDNQGIHGLRQYHCTRFVISDACGQMGVENEMPNDPASVLLRVSSVLQDRVRSEAIEGLIEEKGQNNVAFLDLRQGLAVHEIAWIDNQGKQEEDKVTPATSEQFGVHPEVQEKLSLIRTDLDAFTEVEAYSLMLNGYLGSKHELLKLGGRITNAANWQFQDMEQFMAKPSTDYLKQLDVAKLVPFKTLRFYPVQIGVSLLLVIAVLLYSFHAAIIGLLSSSIPVAQIANAILFVLAAVILNALAPKLAKAFSILKKIRPLAELVKRVVTVTILLVFGTLICRFYLKVINPLFLKRGRFTYLK